MVPVTAAVSTYVKKDPWCCDAHKCQEQYQGSPIHKVSISYHCFTRDPTTWDEPYTVSPSYHWSPQHVIYAMFNHDKSAQLIYTDGNYGLLDTATNIHSQTKQYCTQYSVQLAACSLLPFNWQNWRHFVYRSERLSVTVITQPQPCHDYYWFHQD